MESTKFHIKIAGSSNFIIPYFLIKPEPAILLHRILIVFVPLIRKLAVADAVEPVIHICDNDEQNTG